MSNLKAAYMFLASALGLTANVVALLPLGAVLGAALATAVTGSSGFALAMVLALVALGMTYRVIRLEASRRALQLAWMRAASNATVVAAALELADTPATVPNSWLPNPRDLSTLSLSQDALISLRDTADKRLNTVLKECDITFANIVLMVTQKDRCLTTAPWVGFAARSRAIPKTAAVTFRGSGDATFVQDWPIRDPGNNSAGLRTSPAMPWMDDPTWQELIQQSWMAMTTLEPGTASTRGFEGAVVLMALPRWARHKSSAWRISYRPFDAAGPSELPTDFELRDGRLVQV